MEKEQATYASGTETITLAINSPRDHNYVSPFSFLSNKRGTYIICGRRDYYQTRIAGSQGPTN
jgi:hypothetical protein